MNCRPLSLLSSTPIQPRNGTARSPLSVADGSSGAKRRQERGWLHRRSRAGFSGRTAPRRINSRSWDRSLDFADAQPLNHPGPGIQQYANDLISDDHLTTFRSYNTGRRTISDRIRSVFKTGQGQNSKPSKRTVDPSIDENKSDRRSTTYAATKLAIKMVRESSDVFPPLKSVAGGLSAILDHCDVGPPLSHQPALMLIAVLANDILPPNNRIVDTPG